MDFLSHPVTKRCIDKLVTLYPAPAFECHADNEGLEVLAIPRHLHVLARQA